MPAMSGNLTYSGIDRPANVHLDVRPSTGPVAVESIYLYFSGRDTLREVEEHLAGIRTPDVANIWCLVKAKAHQHQLTVNLTINDCTTYPFADKLTRSKYAA